MKSPTEITVLYPTYAVRKIGTNGCYKCNGSNGEGEYRCIIGDEFMLYYYCKMKWIPGMLAKIFQKLIIWLS